MFSGARGVSIRDSEINNVAGDMIINVHGQPDLEPVQVPLSSSAILFFSRLTWNASYQSGIA